jgi:hypothetical protein
MLCGFCLAMFQAQLWTQKSATLQNLISIFAAMQGFRLPVDLSFEDMLLSFYATFVWFSSPYK